MQFKQALVVLSALSTSVFAAPIAEPEIEGRAVSKTINLYTGATCQNLVKTVQQTKETVCYVVSNAVSVQITLTGNKVVSFSGVKCKGTPLSTIPTGVCNKLPNNVAFEITIS